MYVENVMKLSAFLQKMSAFLLKVEKGKKVCINFIYSNANVNMILN